MYDRSWIELWDVNTRIQRLPMASQGCAEVVQYINGRLAALESNSTDWGSQSCKYSKVETAIAFASALSSFFF
jgi:hypothetical protein